ncbi:Anaphase-promoting complex subunit 2 [Coemansia asiatica]|uniref:Anaphase-promoting complex subunit 2 n=1 Tax=Coemansia asiatica TaxID=1052880 RepID=A0A9W7XGN6_9FUNG|nr:Anaphase-promoting complex subunit 2 [Coemansia asiatica]
MDTSSFDLCRTFSKDELQRIIQSASRQQQQQKQQKRQKHAKQKQPEDHPLLIVSQEQRIDGLAIKYRERLQALLQTSGYKNSQDGASTVVTAIESIDSLDQFTLLLTGISEIGAEFESQATAAAAAAADGCSGEQRQEMIVRSAWQALVYGVFDQEMLQRVGQWMFASATCIAFMLCKIRCGQLLPEDMANGVDADVVARLHRYHAISGGRPVIIALEQQPAGDISDNIIVAQNFQALCSDICRDTKTRPAFTNRFARGCQALTKMHGLRYTKKAILGAVNQLVHILVQRQAGQWETPRLQILQDIVSQTASTIDAFLLRADEQAPQVHQTVEHSARQELLQKVSEQRTMELFSIIIDFPSSTAAITDLRTCVSALNNMHQVAESLKTAVQTRLLHPAATTNDILMQYISAIRCLRLLDPTGTVLEIVAQPIRQYLRQRDDTVSCIVQDMVSEESELFEDLASGSLILDNDPEGVVYDEDYATRDWQPLPIEARNVFHTAQRRDADVLGLLVSVFDSKDVFVQEFETYLARSLLRHMEYDKAREIRQVEMMKLRFGDRALEKCEVMLKDLAESKRTDQLIAEAAGDQMWDLPLHAVVVSRQFWAAAPVEKFVMPREMAEMKEKYAGVYESIRPARKLEWRDSLGQVRLTVQLADRAVDVAATPAQAAVLMAFGADGMPSSRLTVAELAEQLECSEDFVLPRLRFWQSQGVLREVSPGAFEPIEHQELHSHGGEKETGDEDDSDSYSDPGDAHVDSNSSRTETLRMHFNYIVGMLTNIGPLPLDRIHSMLGMFIPGDTTTIDELRGFLALMVREDRLELSGGTYRLK